MAGYASRVKTDIKRWVDLGLIDASAAERLQRDVEQTSKTSISFGSILAIMAAVLVGAAILITVAANWETIPRLTRVLVLFALILGGYVGGAVLKARGHAGFSEALYLVGIAAFGASIALIGQMYHLSGDEAQAILVWCLGAMVAAAALRSPILTNASVVLAVAWLLTSIGWFFSNDDAFPHGFLLLVAVIWALSYWTDSRATRHLLLLSVIFYAFLYGLSGPSLQVGALLAVVSALVFFAAHVAHDHVERFARLGGPYPAHPLIGFLVGLAMVQANVIDELGPMLITTIIAFAGIVAALLLRGRESRLMRWIAYAAFIVELSFLYIVTFGTMVDTGVLFLLSGFALAIVAFFITRIERRIAVKPVEGGAA